jgi:Flp pilus assembly protein TadD
VRYERVWADDLTFWSDVAAKTPTDALPHRELATALVERGRLAEAESELLHALAGRADAEGRAMTYNNLGNLYRRVGRFEDAQQAFEAGLKIVAHPTLYHNLGMMLMSKIEREQQAGDQAALLRDMAQARAAFAHALQLGQRAAATSAFPQWDEAKTHALLGQVLFSLGDRAGAREHLETALRLEPRGTVADVTRRYMQKLQP